MGTVLSFRRRSLIKFTFLLIIKWYSFSPFSAIMTYASRSMPSFKPAWGHDCHGVTGGSLEFWYSCLLASHWHSHRALPYPWSMSHTYQGLLRRTGKVKSQGNWWSFNSEPSYPSTHGPAPPHHLHRAPSFTHGLSLNRHPIQTTRAAANECFMASDTCPVLLTKRATTIPIL